MEMEEEAVYHSDDNENFHFEKYVSEELKQPHGPTKPQPQGKRRKKQTVYELLDREKFIDFIYNRPKPYDGILQKFIEPKGE